VLAAIGCGWLVQSAWRPWPLRMVSVALLAALIVLQAMFIGVYGLIRLPVAFGLKSESAFFSDTPTFQGSFYDVCRYVSGEMAPGEHYISLLNLHSYWCPQRGTVRFVFYSEAPPPVSGYPDPPPLTPAETAILMERDGIRFVVVPTVAENRENSAAYETLTPYDLTGNRIGAVVAPVLAKARPVFRGGRAVVYDGAEVMRLLRDEAGRR
jgi:hypothetical protein